MSTRTEPTTETQTFWCRMDNYEPISREHFRGKLRTHIYPSGEPSRSLVIEAPNPFLELHKKGPGIVFVLDDGESAEPYYVTGYNPNSEEVFIQPYPVNPEKSTRPDGRIIDFSTWKLGPVKSYHLKLHD